MTQRCNLKLAHYFGEVANMQMICERTHETFWNSKANLLKNNWKWMEVFIGTKGPNFIKDGSHEGGGKCPLSYFNSSVAISTIGLFQRS